MRDAHRHSAEPERQWHAEILDDLMCLSGEALPQEVGLGAGQQEVGSAVGVVLKDDLQRWIGVLDVTVLVERNHRTPSAIVKHRVDVVLVQDLTRSRAQLVGGEPGR